MTSPARFTMQLAMWRANKRQLERDGSCGELSTEHYDLYQSLDMGQPHPGWPLYFCWRLQDQFPCCGQCILPRRGAQGFPFTLGLFIELMYYPHLLLLSIGRCEMECRSSVCHCAPLPLLCRLPHDRAAFAAWSVQFRIAEFHRIVSLFAVSSCLARPITPFPLATRSSSASLLSLEEI